MCSLAWSWNRLALRECEEMVMEYCTHLLTSHAYLQENYSSYIQHSDETTESQSKEYDELLLAWDA